MDSVLYTAASGMIARQRDLDVIANNLANASVSGYRPDGTFYEIWRRTEGNGRAATSARETAANTEVHVPAVYMLDKPGAIVATGAPLDLAIEGDGWFVVQAKSGIRYTRGGALRTAADGTLVTPDGSPVLGDAGPITIPRGQVVIGADGRIEVDGAAVGTLRIAAPKGADLLKEGANLYRLLPGAGEQPAGTDVFIRQGSLEQPAVSPVEELVKLVAAQRAFEQHAKTVSLIMNEIDLKAVNEIAQP